MEEGKEWEKREEGRKEERRRGRKGLRTFSIVPPPFLLRPFSLRPFSLRPLPPSNYSLFLRKNKC
jgi:hypothetical protein